MPVNTAALKTFAPAMRRQLLEAVGRKLDLLLNSQTPDTLSTYARQIAELREQEAENREQLLERVAYTWFNRLCALRYLDARSWHPFGCKVLMPAGEGETQPELLKLMRGGSLPAELKSHTNEAHLHGLLDGQIPPAVPGADPQGEVYRELVLASCRSYHQLLPDLFEGLDDASELLLPDDLLSEGSIAGGFRIAISDEDCEDVEIIGWLYQFYISEKKDQVIGKVVKSEDIPAATQLFTPNWIVKYMVQNSLGATWLATYPNSPLKGQMEFYIEPAEQTPEVQAQLAVITPESLNTEELTLIDPACGSGHILVEAYDLLKTIYLERGYRQRDIPELILTKNLYGLDICPRAAQLAAFSLLMKGREDDRRLLDRGIRLNVMALQDSSDFNDERLAAIVDLAIFDLRRADLRLLAEVFANVTTLGSLIQIPLPLAIKLPALSGLAETPNQDLLVSDSFELLRTLTRQACILAQQYSAVVANPPYMGSRMLTPLLKYHTREIYSAPKGDLYAACMIRYQSLAKERGRIGLMTPSTWMTLQSYEKLREQLLSSTTIDSFIEPELHSFFDSAYVSICTFVLSKPRVANVRSPFVRLSDFYGAELQPLKTVEAIKNRESDWMHMAAADDFSKLPGTPIVYHISERLRSLFVKLPALSEKLDLRQGMATTDNDQFLRLWHEVSIKRIGFNCQSAQDGNENGKDWFPYNKGGAFRKWYGNNSFIVLYEDDGEQLVELVRKKYPKISDPEFVIKNRSYYFRPSITWSALTVGALSLRMNGPGFIFDTKGQCGFAGSDSELLECMAFLNTKVAVALAPTMDYNSGTIAKVPYSSLNPCAALDVARIASRAREIARDDWDSFESSWDFCFSPILQCSLGKAGCSMMQAFESWASRGNAATSELCDIELENNTLFLNAYGLESEIAPDVPISQITLLTNPASRYGGNLRENELRERFRRDTIAEFLSYATGCMMGRYSLDQTGLILADSYDSQAAHLSTYEDKVGKPISEIQFKPDQDAIIPVLDGEWFEDDIVARTREFLAVTFPESSVGENLRFIEESLGKDIRKYFCSEFYKDHLQTYKKRPIYWMVQSPKKGFSCLIYLHRYTKDTLNQVLNNYFRPYLQKLEARLAQLDLDQLNDDLPARERSAARKEAEKITKVLKECQTWEQDALLPLAQQRIELDLDDGVKVNYLKLQDVLAPIPGLAAKED